MTAANPNIDHLLRHQDWVRALARSLVADPSRAEDVAQQTMLEAITKAPRDLQRPKGWLAQVARNAARAFARSDRRRRAREQEVAKSDTVLVDPADTAHRAQAHKSLVDEVFELPEPYHTVVLLRYFEDLEPQQIAEQLDRSVSTVRTQLQRGLAMMRDKLDRRFGDRGVWHAAILPLFTPKQVAAGVPILTAIGSLAMWKLLMPVVALIAALLIGLETMWAETPAIPDQGAAGVPAVAVVSETKNEQPVGRDQVEVTTDTPTVSEVAEHRFHARVVSVDGTPFAGLTIAYRAYETPRLEGGMLRVGNTSMPVDQPSFRDILGSREEAEVFAKSFGDQKDAVVALLLGEEINLPRAVSDARGQFSFEDPKVADYLVVEREGFMIYGSGRLPADESLVYVVGPCVEVAGHTVDEHGKALDGVYVSMGFTLSTMPGFGQQLEEGNFRSWNANTASDGSFSLGKMPQHSALWVNASKQGYTRVQHKLSEIRGPVRWELRTKVDHKQKVLTGIVRLVDGRPAAKASVAFGMNRGVTDEHGRFSMPYGYNSDNTSLTACLPGCQAAVRPRFAEQLSANPELAHDIELQLGSSTLSISGRVLDADGKPLKNVVVLLADGVSDGSANQWIESVLANQSNKGERTDASGAFTLNGLSARNYNIRAIDETSHVVLESGPIQAGTDDLVLRVAADAHRRLEGVVVDNHNNPIADVSISLVTPRMQGESGTYWHSLGGKVKTGAQGRFVFEGCPRKFAHLWLDGATVDTKSMKVPEGEQLLRIVLPRWIKFRLRITSNLGADHFAVLDSTGKRIKSSCHMVGAERTLRTHPVVAENAPFYQADDRAVELLLLKDKKEVGRVPLNLRVDQFNTIDI